MSQRCRIGHGIDVHRFAEIADEERPLKLAGIVLPENYTLLAHSDGDVILHAICDAVLGACSAGDIGEHFPETDERFSDIDSSRLVEMVLEIMTKQDYQIVNIDITMVAEVPKLYPYRKRMIGNLSSLLQLSSDRLNLKATTTEGLGYIGREEGIACHCVVLLAPVD
ncbi:MAG: 2-C-methyl-D-erythritol 2,4-cyclodiphosphate synthase [Gammaproteobacteria bacterium]|nr:2-C-methyl-D-erythritol 2,4-cyclodiphosphate synthase [Gammaproteobacteria bacterium]